MEDGPSDGKSTLLREFKAVKSLQARLGNAIVIARKLPENDATDELLECLYDVRKLAEKLRTDLEVDKRTYGL